MVKSKKKIIVKKKLVVKKKPILKKKKVSKMVKKVVKMGNEEFMAKLAKI